MCNLFPDFLQGYVFPIPTVPAPLVLAPVFILWHFVTIVLWALITCYIVLKDIRELISFKFFSISLDSQLNMRLEEHIRTKCIHDWSTTKNAQWGLRTFPPVPLMHANCKSALNLPTWYPAVYDTIIILKRDECKNSWESQVNLAAINLLVCSKRYMCYLLYIGDSILDLT